MEAQGKSSCAKAEAELNRVYRTIRKTYADDALFLKKLKAAQEAWFKYRDAHIESQYPEADKRLNYGSVYTQCRCEEDARLTRARTAELNLWLRGNEEGEGCYGSVKLTRMLPGGAASTSSAPKQAVPQGPSKVRVTSVRASSEYSSAYGPAKSVDGNLQSYWSTTTGAVVDVSLDYFLGSPSRVARLRIYSPQKGAKYGVPRAVRLTFYGANGRRLGQQSVRLNGPYDTWQDVQLRQPVDGVARIQLQPTALTNDVASWVTIHELEFHNR